MRPPRSPESGEILGADDADVRSGGSDRDGRKDRHEESSRRDDARGEGRHASREESGKPSRGDSRSRHPRADEGREVSGGEGSGRDRGGRDGGYDAHARGQIREPDGGRDRDRDRDREKERDRDREKERDRDKESSRRSGGGEGARERHRERERERGDRGEQGDRGDRGDRVREQGREEDQGHKRRRKHPQSPSRSKRSRSRSREKHEKSRSRSRSLKRSRSPRKIASPARQMRRASRSPSRGAGGGSGAGVDRAGGDRGGGERGGGDRAGSVRRSRSPARGLQGQRRHSRSPSREQHRRGGRSPDGRGQRRSRSPGKGYRGASRSRSPRRHRRDAEGKRDKRDSRGDRSPQELPDEVEEKLLKFVGEVQEDEEDEEQRRIEERRRRLQEIKLKHQQMAAAQGGAGAGTAAPTGAPPPRNQSFVREGSEAPSELPGPSHAAAAAGAVGAPPSDGERTPEGERESDSDDEAGADGPVMDIFADGGGGAGPGIDDGAVAASAPASTIPTGSATGAAKVTHETGGALARQRTQDADDEDDMFAEHAPEDKLAVPGGGGAGAGAGAAAGGAVPAQAAALADAYDDHEGYYNFVVGEVMDGRYEVFASNGKGVFSSVVRARDMATRDEAGRHPEVAIKLIRSNEIMFKAALTEIQVLELLAKADPDNHKHCIHMLRHFEYRNHKCLVFEPMAMNLRDLTRKFGRNKGLDIKAVQLFTCQLLIALRHLKKHQILHADIKPDNILINHRHNKVKLCDFGSAMFLGDNEVTPYLVSRFYRAPEVVLGLKYDYGMDMWSIGCVIYELFTGRILFPGHTNNEMLKLMMEVKGPFTKKMLRRGMFVDKHFENDQNMSFASMEDDPITKTKVRRLITNPTVKNNFMQLLQRSGNDKADKQLVAQLADLLEKMMNLEPEKRIDVDAALKHPFVRDVLPKRKEAKDKQRKQT